MGMEAPDSMRTPRARNASFDQPDDTRLSRVNYFRVASSSGQAALRCSLCPVCAPPAPGAALRRASEVTQLSARAIHPERAERARRPLGGVEKTAIRREVKISGPDVIVGIARGLVRARRADCATRHAGDEL